MGKKARAKLGKPHRCELCGNGFATEEKLRKHFKQLHEREHKKQFAHRWVRVHPSEPQGRVGSSQWWCAAGGGTCPGVPRLHGMGMDQFGSGA